MSKAGIGKAEKTTTKKPKPTKARKSVPYPHLIREVIPAFAKTDKERENLLFQKQFIPYTQACSILGELEDLYSLPRGSGCTNMLVLGPAGNGKTVISKEFESRHPRVKRQGCADIVPVCRADAPPEAVERRIYAQILDSLDLDYSGDRTESLLRQLKKSLRVLEVRVLLLDEIQGILDGDDHHRRICLNALKNLTNAIEIPIIGFGLETAESGMSMDDDFSRRFPVVQLRLWENNDEYASLLKSYEQLMPLKRPSNLTDRPLAEAILSRGKNLIGGIDEIIAKSTRLAIREGTEQITLDLVNRVSYKVPLLPTS
jgi:hypothetical protein